MNVALLIVVGLALVYGWKMVIKNHELAHAQICEYYGGKVESVKKNFFWGEVVCNQPSGKNKEIAIMDSMNDIFLYNFAPLYVAISLILIFIAMVV